MKTLDLARILLISVCVGLAGCGTGLQTSGSTAANTIQVAATLTPAIDGQAYSSALTASGGSAHYNWSVASGTMPAGLQLSSTTGVISGTPTQTGTSNFTISVTDASVPNVSVSAAVALTVLPRLTISPSSLPSIVIGGSYNSSLSVSGGTAPYKWTVQSGQLPAGISMSAGTFSGSPTTAGTSNFTIAVTDSGNPIQSVSVPFSITVNSGPLTIQTTSLPNAQTGAAYSAALQATGGVPAYSWAIASGSLPQGLQMATSGSISGTPTLAGTSNFSVAVGDQGGLSVVRTVALSIVVKASPLQVATPVLSAGTVGTGYSAALQASGGTPGYTWSVSSGSLPAGLNLGADTGIITGTPTTSGTSTLTFTVRDNGSPAQSQTVSATLTIAAAVQTAGTTWYVRPDGGTRYSTKVTQGQCDGKADAPYPGNGTNQHCAFKDVRYFWQDGSYTVSNAQSAFPAYGWIGAGGDTYIIRGSVGTGVSYRVGWQNNTGAWDDASNQYLGVQGDPYGSGAPVPLSGTPSQHTRILGENYGSCHTPGAKTQLHGGYGVSSVLDMTGASYVDVQCLDITDFDQCGRASQKHTCNSQVGSLSDYAGTGISWSRTSTNDTLTDVHIHGMALTGMSGPTGDGIKLSYIDMIGNAASGWNADAGDGTTGTGTLLVQNYNISWNGCAEEYPVVDTLPYQDCTDDNSGGYGDGFGTATTQSNPAWNVTFDQGIASYNTQDGLDALHLTGSGSSMTITRTLAYGNMGQQIKVGGASGTATNNMIMTNCNALRQAIPGTPAGYNSSLSDFCRASDTGVLLTLGVNTLLTFDNNTVYSASSTGVEIDCDGTNGNCNSTSKIDFRNNIFVGFKNNSADGYPSGGTNDYSNPIYNGVGFDFFGNAGSLYSNNITFHAKSNWNCPAAHEQNALCVDPGLTDENWHTYGYSDMTPMSSSVALRAGTAISALSIDYAGNARGNPPTIGALEK